MTDNTTRWWANIAASYPIAVAYFITTFGWRAPSTIELAGLLAAPVFVPLGLVLFIVPAAIGFTSAASLVIGWTLYFAGSSLAYSYLAHRDGYRTTILVARRVALVACLHVALTYVVASALVLFGHRSFAHRHGVPYAVIGAPLTVPELMHMRAEQANEYFPWEGSGEVMSELRRLNFSYLLPIAAVYFALVYRRPIWDWYMRPLREKWRREGRCEQCGYDIRATPERCPECGTSVATTMGDP